MDQEITHQLASTAEKLATAAEALDRVLGRLDAQQEALNAKVDRIVAAVEESPLELEAEAGRDTEKTRQLEVRVAELEKTNGDLKAQAARMTRKTLSPLVTALLGKKARNPETSLIPRCWTKLSRHSALSSELL